MIADDILGWFNPTRWIILAVLLASLVAGYFGWAHHQQSIGEARGKASEEARWTKAINKQKAEAVQLLAAETARANKATSELNAARAALEETDAKHHKTVAGLERRLADSAAVNGGRLRDPNATGCRGSGGAAQASDPASAVGGPASGAETGGLLSVQLSDLLRARLHDADEVNRAYIACRADSFKVRESLAVKP